MNVKIDKWILDDYNYSYKITEIDKCCDKLLNSPNELGTGFPFALINTSHDEWNKACTHKYKVIRYCPFCGEKITLEIIPVDKQEEYKALLKQREMLSQICSSKYERLRINTIEGEIIEMCKYDGFQKGRGIFE